MQMPTLDIAGRTDPGLKRANNEDAYKIFTPSATSTHAERGYLVVVADGMGGMGGGDVASKTTVDALSRGYYGTLDSVSLAGTAGPTAHLQGALEMANAAVREQAKQLGVPRIGSTVAGLTLTPDGEVTIFNVGDSRVYRIRNRAIERMSQDQSVMELQVNTGLVSEEEAKKDRNNNLTSFIGQLGSLVPNYHRLTAQEGDIFIICSDGLWSLFEPSEILNFVDNVPAKTAVAHLVEEARKRGAPDNVTVIVVRIGRAPSRRALWIALAGLAALIATIVVVLVGLAISSAYATKATPTVLVAVLMPRSTSIGTASSAANGSVTVAPSATAVSLLIVATSIPSMTQTVLPTLTASLTATPTASTSPTTKPTATSLVTNTASVSPTFEPTVTPLPTNTASATNSATPTFTPTSTVTLLPTNIAVLPAVVTTLPPTITLGALLTPTKAATKAPTPKPSVTRTATRTATATRTPSVTATVTATPTLPRPPTSTVTGTLPTPTVTATVTQPADFFQIWTHDLLFNFREAVHHE